MRPCGCTPSSRLARLWLLALACLSGGELLADVRRPPIDVASVRDWHGSTREHTLPDGSTMTVYASASTSLDSGAARLEVGFSPRFECAPWIRFVLSTPLTDPLDAALDTASLSADAPVSVRIDGTALDWPIAVDRQGDERLVWLLADRQARTTARLSLDAGTSLGLALGNGVSLNFSLLGSRKSLAATQALCRAHEPVAWP